MTTQPVSIGRYQIKRLLGEGGMGSVFQAYDPALGRDVAIKIIRVDQQSHPKLIQRFSVEANALAQLSHPNIIGILDYGEYNEMPYLVMDYISGSTLSARAKNPMPWQEAAALLLPIARALAFAHARGIIHRDIKPANILLDQNNNPMLSDFGLAKLLGREITLDLTNTGAVIGTPEYIAPEQARGKEIDGRADMYALGCVFYRLITGHIPYEADTPIGMLLKHVSASIPNPRHLVKSLPVYVENVIIKSMAKDPESRYADMEAFSRVLEQLALGNSKVNTLPPPPKNKLRTLLKRITPLALILLLLTIIVTLWQPDFVSKYFSPSAAPVISEITRIKTTKEQPTHPLLTQTNSASRIPVKNLLLTDTPAETSDKQIPTPSETIPAQNTPPGEMTNTPTVLSHFDGMVMLFVPQGSFLMGSAPSDPDAASNEKPQHTLNMAGFWIDRIEITNAMYALCVKETICKTPASLASISHADYFNNNQYANFPVINVTWVEADTYCKWAGRRLPTEAEWEKAARGEDGRLFPWGNEMPDNNRLNFNIQSGDAQAAGSYPEGASLYGAVDMAGNVWEWTADIYHPNYLSGQSQENNGSQKGNYRVIRGGSFYEPASSVRVAARQASDPYIGLPRVGFRCAVDNP